MSDVLVKGMDMPTACRHGECNFACSAAYKTGLICIIRKQYVVPGDVPRDCPCSFVPPHGRLIDADALMETTDGIWDCNDLYFQPNDKICDPDDCKGCKWRETMDCFRRMIKHTPTIIPADPAEEGEA
jgi:hypothetical protein